KTSRCRSSSGMGATPNWAWLAFRAATTPASAASITYARTRGPLWRASRHALERGSSRERVERQDVLQVCQRGRAPFAVPQPAIGKAVPRRWSVRLRRQGPKAYGFSPLAGSSGPAWPRSGTTATEGDVFFVPGGRIPNPTRQELGDPGRVRPR